MKSLLILFFTASVGTAQVAATLEDNDSILVLQPSGSILGPPSWTDSSSEPVFSVIFDFSGLEAGEANRSIRSDVQTIVFSDPENIASNITITLDPPSGCGIGREKVSNSDVSLVFNSEEYNQSTSLNITEGAQNNLELVFSQKGKYGNNSGVVSCSGSGSLTFAY